MGQLGKKIFDKKKLDKLCILSTDRVSPPLSALYDLTPGLLDLQY